MRKKLLFMLNPRAGRGAVKDGLLDVVNLFCEYGYDVTVFPTRDAYRINDIVRDHQGQFDLVVCSGGDGTLNETITALLQYDMAPRLGYIPAGTTNDFARTLGLTGDYLLDAKLVAEGSGFLCDVGAFNDQYFTYIAAFGVFTEASYATPQFAKNIFGRAAYIAEGALSLTDLRGYELRMVADGNVVEGEFIYGSVSNSTSVAGFNTERIPGIELDDGLFEVLLVRRPRSFSDFTNLANALLTQKPDDKTVLLYHAAHVTIDPVIPMPWTLDGEFGGAPSTIDIRSLPKALEFIVPNRPVN